MRDHAAVEEDAAHLGRVPAVAGATDAPTTSVQAWSAVVKAARAVVAGTGVAVALNRRLTVRPLSGSNQRRGRTGLSRVNAGELRLVGVGGRLE